MNNYEVSIVTPYHNIDLDIFKSGLESIKNQTLGFSKIEWIIVLHNCEDKYIQGVQEMTKEYENIKTFVLNNNVHSASSPRNYGMKMASAKYIGFLDGDDSYTPGCLKTVLLHMKKSGAQVTWFRREYELESEKSVPVTEIVLWDQTREEIILEKGGYWDDEKMFSAVWGLVTSRLYDLDFLRENEIVYDESVKLGEDYLFNFEVYGRAQKFCYLPQTIGYHYYINGGSILQKSEKTEEDIIDMAKGLKKIYDCGLKFGFRMDATIGGVTFVLARFMMGSSKLSLEGRQKIKKIVGPYVEMIKDLKPNKIYSEKAAYDRSTFLKDYILNPEKWAGEGETFMSRHYREVKPPVDQTVLNSILENNAGTDMGKRYDFKSINTLNGFQSKVPVMQYDTYEPLIALNTRIGESGIFVSEPITHYVYYTGQYGNRKLLPVTQSHLKDYVKAMDEVFKDNNTFVLYENVSKPFHFNDNSDIGSLYGAINTEYYKARVSGDVSATSRFTTPDSLGYSSEQFTNRYIKCLFALCDENVTQICAPSMNAVMGTLDFIKKNIDDFTSDIAAGTIKNLDRLKEDNAKALLKAFSKNNERAEYLKKVFEGEVTLKAIWPGLKKIVAPRMGDFALGTKLVERVSGDVELLDGPLMYPEMLLGTASDENGNYELNLESAFFEFKKVGDSELIFYKKLKAGEIYRVFVTNKSGLYRYDTGRHIKIVGFNGSIPVFEPLSDYGTCTMIGNISIGRDDINGAVLQLGDACELSIFDYASYQKNDSLCVLLELADNSDMNSDLDAVKHKLDEILCEVVAGYKSAREAGEIDLPDVHLIEPETTLLYQESRAKKLDVTVDSIPAPHFVYNPKDIKFLEMAII
ncbi:MAG: GH3 auxin-responsive promoter family protein [Lachnospiraceae bacterium]|nr:GH3 auxin-responsive promoter family protein [Candidatus Merdinaster equi]